MDTSVVFAAVMSPAGGSRKLFRLAEAGLLELVVGPTVLTECEDVIHRKAPRSLPILAQLLTISRVETSLAPTKNQVSTARSYVQYSPDARVLAEAIQAKVDWFVTHDKDHFLKARLKIKLRFEIGTPGDLIQRYIDDLDLL